MRLIKAAATAVGIALLFSLAVLDVAGVTIPAFAAEAASMAAAATPDTTSVTVQVGPAIANSVAILSVVLAIGLTGLLALGAKFLPAPLQAFVNAKNIAALEQLLERGLAFGLNKAAEEMKDKTVTVDVRSAAVAGALQYALDHGPEKLINWAGGEEQLEQKIIARLPIPDAVKDLLKQSPAAG